MYDDASTITMQSQKNIVYSTGWNSGSSSEGPIIILSALEKATAGWSNVKDITYTAGTTTFKTNAYTGCSAYNTCTKNTYTIENHTAKARLITMQETAFVGCTSSLCPKWVFNYLSTSTSNGGTVNDTSASSNSGYWTMSTYIGSNLSWYVSDKGYVTRNMNSSYYGARAVVQVSKQ